MMNDERWGGLTRLLVSVASVVVVWGIVGMFQQGPAGRGGYSVWLGGFVSHVEENGPADSAGLLVGDRITHVGSTRLDHPWSRPDLDPVGAGNLQSLMVERAGETSEVEFAWKGLTWAQWRPFLLDFLITIGFLGFGLWAFLGSGTLPGLVLAVFGLSYGFTNFRVPGFFPLEGGIRFLQQNLSLFYTALLLHFFLVFPRKKTLFRRPIRGWVIYLPFFPFLLFGLVEWAVFPAFLSEYRFVAGITDQLYMVLALVALLHTSATLGWAELSRTRFVFVLLGLAIAIGPLLALGVLGLVLPGFVLPGSEYLVLLGVVIPGSMALAVVSGTHRASSDAETS